MKIVSGLVILSLTCSGLLNAQARPVDWPSYGGDARRTGWEKSDSRITKENVKDFKLVLKRKFESKGGTRALSAPVIIGLLISYKGFKELGFVAGAGNSVWSLDVDTDRIFWEKRIETTGKAGSGNSASCTAGFTAMPALTPPASFGGARRNRNPGASPSPGVPPTPAGRNTSSALPARLAGVGFGTPRPVYVVTSDGKLHQVNTSNGSDQFPPLDFLPGDAKASSLTLNDYTMYTTTSGDCGGVPDGVWALDLSTENPQVTSFPLTGGDAAGLGGYAVGNDGTIYVQTGPGPSDPASNKFSNTLLALTPKTLKLKHYFTTSEGGTDKGSHSGANLATPVVFEFAGNDLIVSADANGRLYLLDSEAVGGADHKTPLFQTLPLVTANSGGGGVWGGISTWEDPDGTRYVAAPVWGKVNPDLKAPLSNGPTPNGAVVTFKVEDKGGKPVLSPAWISRDLSSPQPPVVTGGIVFALSSGSYSKQGNEMRAKGSSRATLYALDGATGKEMYSTGNQIGAPGNLSGLTLANGRVYLTTTDNNLYAFGVFLER